MPNRDQRGIHEMVIRPSEGGVHEDRGKGLVTVGTDPIEPVVLNPGGPADPSSGSSDSGSSDSDAPAGGLSDFDG
ncbi:MAG: hypothetical protein ACRDRX_27275 [Pseudonocardiaceae bacterium]